MKSITAIIVALLLSACHTVKWNDINRTKGQKEAPESILSFFDKYENNVVTLDASSPGFNYKYDIGEKDSLYGHSSNLRFENIEIRLHDKMPVGKILTDITFYDPNNNKVEIDGVDLLRLVPKFDAKGDMIYPEIIEEEFNRFGYSFRKEHNEFTFSVDSTQKHVLQDVQQRAYRCQLVNNCLAATKWEFVLTTEDYSDFNERLKDSINLNQNRILSHSWFFLDKDLYRRLVKLKNPELSVDFMMEYDSISNLAENTVIDFSQLREPIRYRAKTELLEIGAKSGRIIEPLDNEQFYKKEFQLLLEGTDQTYTSILESPVKTTQFKDRGFYTEKTPKEFDLNWMQYLDSVHLNVIDVKGTEAYAEIVLTGQWTPYKINIGNIDLSLLNEQKLSGLLFGINTYPKNRRYNPTQSTLAFDADLLPNDIKPYVLLTNKDDDKWVNNQYKGIEKIYLTYESLERDVMIIYVLSYERITPVWMARIKLSKPMREKLRIRKGLYNY
ncbi:MAG: hypothetical protein MK066_00935 [Crocinitomicaceae bacterium]|nr:hypothetical protein [Crocinitomicaceae bacterium]